MEAELRKSISLVIAAGVLAMGSVSAFALTAGDWVLGNYEGGSYWFPGVISSVDGDRIVVQYDDGETETLSPNQVRPYDWVIGARVECNWQGGGKWYAGEITSLGGARLAIKYEDGETESTTTGMCRSQ